MHERLVSFAPFLDPCVELTGGRRLLLATALLFGFRFPRCHRAADSPLPRREALVDSRHVAVLCGAGDADPALDLAFAVGDAFLGEVSDRVANRGEAVFVGASYVAEQFAEACRVVFFHGGQLLSSRVESRLSLVQSSPMRLSNKTGRS